jgi:hypothetical protein
MVVDLSNNVKMTGSISDDFINAMPTLAYLSIAGTQRFV